MSLPSGETAPNPSSPTTKIPTPFGVGIFVFKDGFEPYIAIVRWTMAHARLDGHDTLCLSHRERQHRIRPPPPQRFQHRLVFDNLIGPCRKQVNLLDIGCLCFNTPCYADMSPVRGHCLRSACGHPEQAKEHRSFNWIISFSVFQKMADIRHYAAHSPAKMKDAPVFNFIIIVIYTFFTINIAVISSFSPRKSNYLYKVPFF